EHVSRIVSGPPVESAVQKELDAFNTLRENEKAAKDTQYGRGNGADKDKKNGSGNGSETADAVDWTEDKLPIPKNYNYSALLEKIRENAWRRSGIDPKNGKCWVRDGLTGATFDHPVTTGFIYML